MGIQKGSCATFTSAFPSSNPATGHSQCAAGHLKETASSGCLGWPSLSSASPGEDPDLLLKIEQSSI